MGRYRDTLEDKVLSFVLERKLIRPGDRVMVGVSGGADSVCLLLMLHELADKLGCSVEAVTVNHGIRGREAAEDVRFVKNLCAENQIPLSVRKVDVPAYVNENGISEETAARILRYEVLTEICRNHRVDKLALAHHRDDQCETVLHHLFRGSSLKGLSGIAPERNLPGAERCTVIRPLLETGRPEIERWLDERYQTWQTDRTNLDETYTRNYIRSELIPRVKEKVNAQAVTHVATVSQDIREAQELIGEMAEAWIRERKLLEMEGKKEQKQDVYPSICIPSEELLELRPIVQREVLMRCLNQLADSGHAVDVGRVHLNGILALCRGENGRYLIVPGRLKARYEYGMLKLTRTTETSRQNAPDIPENPQSVHINKDWAASIMNNDVTSYDSTQPAEYKDQSDAVQPSECKNQPDAVQPSECKNQPDAVQPSEYKDQSDAVQPAEYKNQTASAGTCRLQLPLKSGADASVSPIFIEVEDTAWLREIRLEESCMTLEKDWHIPYTKYLDCDIIKGTLCLRTRRTGDYFLLENGGRKSVKSYMIDRKIPAEERNRMPLLAEGSHVWWLADGRISAACKIRPQTDRVIIIHIRNNREKES